MDFTITERSAEEVNLLSGKNLSGDMVCIFFRRDVISGVEFGVEDKDVVSDFLLISDGISTRVLES